MSRELESDTSLSALKRTIKNLDDIEQIRQLKYRYCDFCDYDYEPDGIASLFVEDGLALTIRMLSPYETGFGKTRLVSP